MLCYVTPKEHLGLPNKEDVRTGIISYKIDGGKLFVQAGEMPTPGQASNIVKGIQPCG